MRSIGRILSHVRELTPYYVGIVACAVLVALTGLASPFLIGRATDQIVALTGGTGGSIRTVIGLAVGLLVADLVNTLISNYGGYLGDQMAARLRAALSFRYYRKLLGLPQRYFDHQLTGTIIGRLNRSITEITQFLNSFSNNFFPMLITLVAVLVITAAYWWPLTVLLVLIFPIYTWLTALTSTKWQAWERAKNEQVDLAGGRFAEVIGQIRVVKSFVAERRELAAFRGHYDTTIELTGKQSAWWHQMDVARRAALNLVFFGIYLMIFLRTVSGHFSVGDLVLLIQLVNLVRQPVTNMSYLVDTAQRAVAGSRDYFAVMDQTPEREDVGGPASTPAVVLDPGTPMVRFDHVRFGYGEDPDVLADITFDVAPGERVALVGESGGGKTTLVSLLLGLYPPRSGEIRIAGYPTGELGLEQLRAMTGVVFQDPSLFSGTIEENIAYGRPDADEQVIEQAAIRANADAFIRAFPDGYRSTIGERGLKLSGGQKQRIAVARAMVKDAPILVLDEATSSLDNRAERLVQEGLDTLMADRTSIIIAHRLSTISAVDRIITLRDGRIDEVGTPEELATSGGIYAELLALQASKSRRDRRKLRDYDIAG